jgi:hypothetical protein
MLPPGAPSYKTEQRWLKRRLELGLFSIAWRQLAEPYESIRFGTVDDEFLTARLARGWTPTATATATVDGEVILGHASCRMSPRSG